MSTTINFPYTTDTNYSFDSNLIEVTGGVAKLKSQVPTDATFGANYTTDEDGVFGDGVLTGTLNGTATVSGGKLDLTGNVLKYVSYDPVDNFDSTTVGTIRMRITPNYSGNPTNDSIFFSISRNDASSDNMILLKQRPNGQVAVFMRSESTVSIMAATLATWVPVSGTEYEFELNWDITSGATRLFIDGVQFGSTQIDTGTRDTNVGLFRVGTFRSSEVADFKVDDVLIFSTVQHTADYTPGYTVSKYSMDNPVITTNASFGASEIETFTATEVKSGSDELKYIITADGQDRYVTGGSAANSDGTYAQASTETEMSSDINNIVSIRRTVTIKTFLSSADGSTTPEIDLISVLYNAALADPTTPTLVEVEGFIYDTNGPIASQQLKVRPFEAGYFNSGIFHKYQYEIVATTDSDGYFIAFVYFQGSGKFWDFKIGTQSYKVALLDQAEMDLKDATTFEVITV